MAHGLRRLAGIVAALAVISVGGLSLAAFSASPILAQGAACDAARDGAIVSLHQRHCGLTLSVTGEAELLTFRNNDEGCWFETLQREDLLADVIGAAPWCVHAGRHLRRKGIRAEDYAETVEAAPETTDGVVAPPNPVRRDAMCYPGATGAMLLKVESACQVALANTSKGLAFRQVGRALDPRRCPSILGEVLEQRIAALGESSWCRAARAAARVVLPDLDGPVFEVSGIEQRAQRTACREAEAGAIVNLAARVCNIRLTEAGQRAVLGMTAAGEGRPQCAKSAVKRQQARIDEGTPETWCRSIASFVRLIDAAAEEPITE